MTKDQIRRGVRAAIDAGLRAKTGWIYGLPGSLAEQSESIDFMLELRPHRPPLNHVRAVKMMTIEKPKLTEGRMFRADRPDEAVADRTLAQALHVHAGSTVRAAMVPTAASEPDISKIKPVTFKIVNSQIAVGQPFENSPSVIDALYDDEDRFGRTQLLTWDAKASGRLPWRLPFRGGFQRS